MIELTYLALIGIALAAMFFGYGFGLFEWRGQGYKKRKKEEQAEQENQKPPEPKVVTQTVTVDDPGLLRIKNEGGSYALDLDGARVDPAALSPEQRKRLIETLNIMRPWLEGKPAPAPAPSVTPAPQSSLLDRMQSKSVAPAPPAQTPPAFPPAQPATPPPASKPGTIAKEDRP